jgi:hypothetical protein
MVWESKDAGWEKQLMGWWAFLAILSGTFWD